MVRVKQSVKSSGAKKIPYKQTKLSGGRGKTVAPVVKERAPHRNLPGTVAKRNIRSQQKSTKTLIRKSPFTTMVRTVVLDVPGVESTPRFQHKAMLLLQAITEAQLIAMLHRAKRITSHAKRETVSDADMELAQLD